MPFGKNPLSDQTISNNGCLFCFLSETSNIHFLTQEYNLRYYCILTILFDRVRYIKKEGCEKFLHLTEKVDELEKKVEELQKHLWI